MRRALVATACTLLILGVLGPVQPAFATPPTGALLNPSNSDTNGPGTFISDQNDGTDKLFHFAVRAVPTTSGASVTSVRIQIQPPNVLNFQTIGNATQVGSTDTWELKWNQTASGIATGDGNVRVQVQDSNGEVAYVPSPAGQLVHFDDTLPAVEMTNPADGSTLGFFGGKATITFTASADTDEVDVFYTTSQATQAQSWQSCGAKQFAPGGTSSQTVTCTLNGTDQASQVAAVAALPFSDLPIPRTQGAGDAHRVSPFGEMANSVVITSAGPSQSVFHCQLFTLQVLDNLGSNVSGANVDVHAQGPANDVYFSTVSGKTDSFTAPSVANANTHHNYETGESCDKHNASTQAGGSPAAPGQSDAEGVHTGTTPNIKHIDGVTTAHGFVFALVSTTMTGTTSIMGWDDGNQNDVNDNTNQQCPASGIGVELCGTASMTWDTPTATTVTVSPTQDSAAVGKSHKLTAEALDQHGNPMAASTQSCCSTTISFAVTKGPNSSQDLDGDSSTPPGYFGFCQTGADGTCDKTYTDQAKTSGIDTITAFFDQDGNLAPGSTEPQATGQQTWKGGKTVTPTSLSIRPNKTQTIARGGSVHFHGRLVSKHEACLLHRVVVLFNGGGPVGRYTIRSKDAHHLSNGSWAGSYQFTVSPHQTQHYHTAFHGTSSCGASRAPKSGGVEVRVT